MTPWRFYHQHRNPDRVKTLGVTLACQGDPSELCDPPAKCFEIHQQMRVSLLWKTEHTKKEYPQSYQSQAAIKSGSHVTGKNELLHPGSGQIVLKVLPVQ